MQRIEIKIKELRKTKGLTQKQLAQELNLKNSTLSRYEANDREPTIKTLIAIADFFDVDLDELVGRDRA